MHAFQFSSRLVPELTEKLCSRYRVLQRIFLHQPIGRRSLALLLGISERILRADVELLKEQGLIDVGPVGMHVTDSGATLIKELDDVIRYLDGRHELEAKLRDVLGIARVVVVPGDSHKDDSVTRDIGYAAGRVLLEYLHEHCTIAVTGGSSLAMLADVIPRPVQPQSVVVVPARGGLGERVELLANTIASRLAERLGGTYRMFHVPESLSKSTAETLAMEPLIQEVVEHIRAADIVVHGIGEALTMARRRKLDAMTISELQAKGAVAEAFGYYFDADGHIIHVMGTVGLRLEDIAHIPVVIGVAGGAGKAQAIRAAAQAYRIDALVTDEGAGNSILQAYESSKFHTEG